MLEFPDLDSREMCTIFWKLRADTGVSALYLWIEPHSKAKTYSSNSLTQHLHSVEMVIHNSRIS